MAGFVFGCRPPQGFRGLSARATRAATFDWWKRSNTFEGCGAVLKGT